ncbi:MAG: histidine phosphatase family protein, partial [Deltaproteobacteria bacterium]|nr:histidine phosphatase family protein [Deltaproteobacteria bacterium]
MSLIRLYLIRHGQVVNHHEFRYNGHFDVDITSLGVLQMENLADYLMKEPISAVYSSDLQRATKGAEIIGKRLGLKPVRIHAFRELHLGRWEGLTREEAAQRFPEEAEFRFRDIVRYRVKGGENLYDLKDRVIPALKEVLSRHNGEGIVLAAHGGVNRVILCDAMGLGLENFYRIEQDYGCLS